MTGALVALLAMMVTGAWGNAARAAAPPRIAIGVEPVLLDVPAPAHPAMLFDGARMRGVIASILADRVVEVARANPSRVIAIRLRDLPLQYERLTPGAASIVQRALGEPDDPAAAYEEAMSAFLREVLIKARAEGATLLSVVDLPQAMPADETAAAGYDPLVAELDAFVASQFFILSESASESSMLDRAVPAMLALREGRPLFYRANWVWRAIVEPDWLAGRPEWAGLLERLMLDDITLKEDPSLRGTWQVARADTTKNAMGEGGSRGASSPRSSGGSSGDSSASSGGAGSSGGGGASSGGGGGGGGGGSGDSNPDDDPENAPLPPLPPGPKRLLHFQQVGWSADALKARVHPSVCSDQLGWQEHVNRVLDPLVQQLGPETFDWWGHWTAGIWAHDNWTTDPWLFGPWWGGPVFEAPEYAAQHFPQLVDYGPLATYASANGIKLYGYTGFARDYPSPRWSVVHPEHSQPEHFMRWYGPFVEAGFVGLGHDWTSGAPANCGLFTYNFPTLREHGIEPFVEANPNRDYPYMLGKNFVAFELRWMETESRPDRFYTDAELRAAGGRTIHIVNRPPDGFQGDRYEWIWNRSVELLREGKTVAVNLSILGSRGYPIRELVRYSRQ